MLPRRKPRPKLLNLKPNKKPKKQRKLRKKLSKKKKKHKKLMKLPSTPRMLKKKQD